MDKPRFTADMGRLTDRYSMHTFIIKDNSSTNGPAGIAVVTWHPIMDEVSTVWLDKTYSDSIEAQSCISHVLTEDIPAMRKGLMGKYGSRQVAARLMVPFAQLIRGRDNDVIGMEYGKRPSDGKPDIAVYCEDQKIRHIMLDDPSPEGIARAVLEWLKT